jgi:hypothetical protein
LLVFGDFLCLRREYCDFLHNQAALIPSAACFGLLPPGRRRGFSVIIPGARAGFFSIRAISGA